MRLLPGTLVDSYNPAYGDRNRGILKNEVTEGHYTLATIETTPGHLHRTEAVFTRAYPDTRLIRTKCSDGDHTHRTHEAFYICDERACYWTSED